MPQQASSSSNGTRSKGLQSRLRLVGDFASKLIAWVYYGALTVILCLSALIFYITYELYPPLIVLVLIVTTCAVIYLTKKRNDARSILSDASEGLQGEREQENESNFRERTRSVVKRAANRAVDTALAATADTAAIGAAGAAVAGGIIIASGFKTVGIAIIVLAAIVYVIALCASSILKSVVGTVIDSCITRVFPSSSNEQTPLKE